MKDKRYRLTVSLEELQYIYDGLVLQHSTFLSEYLVFETKRVEARLTKFLKVAMPITERISRIEGIRN